MIPRLYLVGGIVALAGAVFLLWERNDDLSDQNRAAQDRIKTIKESQEISEDVHSLDDRSLLDELNRRVSEPGSE